MWTAFGLLILCFTMSYAVVHFTHPHRKTITDIVDEHKHGFTPAPNSLRTRHGECPAPAICALPVQCPAHIYDEPKSKCTIAGGRRGICCTSGQNHTAFLDGKGRHHHHTRIRVDPRTLREVARRSHVEALQLHMKEKNLLVSGRSAIVPIGSASFGHFRNTRVYNMNELSEVMSLANRALEIALATREFKDRQGITTQQIEWGLIQEDLRFGPLGHACAPMPDCPAVPQVYRRIDGSCNNLLNPTWGTPRSPYARLLPPSYHDGIWSPRMSGKDGEPLPSPRLISTALFPDADVTNEDYTLMLMQFGQFLSHDITQSIDISFPNGSAISCCNRDGLKEIPPHYRHYACMPIKISPHDEFFSAFKQTCMNFVRSVLATKYDCTLGYAEQMNKITHFIDASAVYGSSEKQIGELRSFEGGRLRVFKDFGRDLLPLAKNQESCLTMEEGSACFDSENNPSVQINFITNMLGDLRTNQMITLVAVHTMFLREHNRLAGELEHLNPHWPDEKLFVEARKILIAELQVITYKEFLPCILGDVTMEEFDLHLEPGLSYSFDYDQRVEPSITNEFASAAFRFGHSMVNGVLKIYGASKMEEMINIPEIMFYPARMRRREFYDEILSTLTTEPIQQVDNFLSDALTKYMFRAGNPFGVDLASLNIQRGRDHGLKPYNDYRELIGLARIINFEQFGKEMGEKLQKLYASVNDIDLWVGGLLESKSPGSVLGPTFRDIVADQFSRLKKGDRYFFDHDPSVNPGHFSPDQIRELKKASMARLVCDNSDGILLVRQAPNAFKKPGVVGNEFVSCSSSRIPRVNLLYWQD